MVDTVAMLQLFGKSLVVEPLISTIGLVGAALESGANDALKETVLPQLIAGEAVASLAWEESDSRGNPACVSTSVEPLAEGFRLRGEKVMVLNGCQADYLLVSARSDGNPFDENGISLFLVDSNAPGVSVQAFPTVDGHRAANISFDVVVPADRILTEQGDGYAALKQAINSGILMLCSEAIGIISALLDTTVEYTSARKQFGVPLAVFQVLRHRMADMYIAYQQASALLDVVVEEAVADDPNFEQSLIALKAFVGQAGKQVADDAIQLHGGMGMTDELNVGHYAKRLFVINQLFGNTDVQLKQLWQSIAVE